MSQALKVGLVVNPIAGLGGSVGLKGSDGTTLQAEARRRGGQGRGQERTGVFLETLSAAALAQIEWWAADPETTAQISDFGLQVHEAEVSVPEDVLAGERTQFAASALLQAGVDLLVFVGGDGTARDVLSAVEMSHETSIPVLGIPAGVKMHSGVFAVSPQAAARIVERLVSGAFVAPIEREVRDFAGVAQDVLEVITYGVLCAPEVGGYLQHTKSGGRESEPLAVEEIVAEMLDRVDTEMVPPIVFGPGGTCRAVQSALGEPGTLRGFDVIDEAGVWSFDVDASALERLENPELVISFPREQGILFGRGNQQLTPAFLDRLDWPARVHVLATRTKIASLDGRPLLVDTGSAELDLKLAGLVPITVGYEDRLLHRVTSASA